MPPPADVQVGSGICGGCLTTACAIGRVSGCLLNPAVSVGLWAGGRYPAED
jgi:glycerol uptake facilitator-like aquaporin